MRVRTQTTPRTKAAVLVAVGALALTAACGTRLPDKDFSLQAQQGGNGTGSTGPAVNGSNGSTGGTTGGTAGGTAGSQGTQGSSSTSGGSQGTTGKGSVSSGNLFAGACGPGGSSGGQSSDTGVSGNQIVIGNVVSQTNPFGSDQFSPNKYGLIAFVQHCNAVGGINGRQIKIIPCNDGGTAGGNVSCVNTLVAQKAFAMVSNNVFVYSGAKTAHDKGLLDIGGEPITGAPYYTYDTAFNMYGDGYPKDNSHAGYKGAYWGTGELGAYLKQGQGISQVGVVYYTQADSQRGYNQIKASLEAAGIHVDGYPVNLATPNYEAAVVSMQQKDPDKKGAVFDALDQSGNEKLCQAMNQRQYIPKAKVSTISTWSDHVGNDFDPPCRDIVWSNGKTASYSDTSVPMVNTFRADFAKYVAGQTMAQWTLEGYAAGIWFAQAAHSCGGALTRGCVKKWLYAQDSLPAEGLVAKDVSFQKKAYSPSKTENDCVEVVKWNNAKKGWDTLASVAKSCYTTHYFSYPLEG